MNNVHDIGYVLDNGHRVTATEQKRYNERNDNKPIYRAFSRRHRS
jgi:hypothetical protein